MANEAFDRWWNSSKYMQVVYSGAAERQIALDAWNARAALASAAVAEREPVAAWQFKHHDPISGHPVWKTTLYWNGHRATESRPLYLNPPPPVSELEAENARLKARLAEVEKALDGLLEPFEGDDCRYDHHGYCQTHFLEEDCCVAAARRVREGGKVDG